MADYEPVFKILDLPWQQFWRLGLQNKQGTSAVVKVVFTDHMHTYRAFAELL